MKNKKIYTVSVIMSILILSLGLLIGLNRNELSETLINKQGEEIVKGISFEPYSLKDEEVKVSVLIQDSEYGLKNVKTLDENGNIRTQYNCNNKNKMSIDINIKGNATYEFIAENLNGELITKTLVIDEQFRENIIDIQISVDEEQVDSKGKVLKGKVDIDFGNNENLNMKTHYRIGKSDWIEYNGTIDVDSSEIVSKDLQEDDGNRIIIYARKRDNAGNEIIKQIETNQFDVDPAGTPQITIAQSAEYPVLTSDGVYLDNTVTIKFDQNIENLINQYSIDGGNTWINSEETIYTFNTVRGIIYARSIKESGLTITKQVNISEKGVTSSSALKSDALGYDAYDGNISTAVSITGVRPNASTKIGGYMMVDESAINKKIRVYFVASGGGYSSAPKGGIGIYGYDDSGTIISSVEKQGGSGSQQTIQTVDVPILEGTKKIYFRASIVATGWSGGSGAARINNIEIIK